MSNKSGVFAVSNAVVQTIAIMASSAGIIWSMYPIMALVAYMTFMQSVAAAGVFSGLVKSVEEADDSGYGLRVLIGIMYLASSYQVYMIGYTVFSGIMFAHAAIYLLTNIFGVIKGE